MPILPLPHDPLAVFRNSRTPPGLYARQKWLDEAATQAWQKDFKERVNTLWSGPFENGLWCDSPLETIYRLFGLHLTVRQPSPPIDRALDRLMDLAFGDPPEPAEARATADRIAGLPFAPGPWRSVFRPAVLFLCSIFGRAEDPRVVCAYGRIVSEMFPAPDSDPEPADAHNLLRALVVHPAYAAGDATSGLVAWLGRRQAESGDWGRNIPFFQALNALAHLDGTAADAQCRRAFDWLVRNQNPDGSWGETEREWATFLAVHSLRNKAYVGRP